MGITSQLAAVLLASAVLVTSAPTQKTYKICVPYSALDSCHRMTAKAAPRGVRLDCFAVRDRMDCYKKIQDGSADFGPADPEDMFVAAHLPDSHFVVFEEIRDKNATHDDVRYGGVALVRTDLDIPSIQSLRGMKSCHTGVGRTVGYKIPLTKLTQMGILPTPDPSEPRTARENELRALSRTFPQACLVGKWSLDDATNQRLKSEYSNLCALCENPEKCDYPDLYSGYDGAIRCMMAPNRGDVAWTKVVVVRQFFGLPPYSRTPEMESDPAMKTDLYSYLCPDGTKMPLTSGTPCTWAGRPWPGFISKPIDSGVMDDMRQQISKAVELGEAEKPWTHPKDESAPGDWLQKVFALREITTAVENGPNPPSPVDYLTKARYNDVIARDLGTNSAIKFCTYSSAAYHKCEVMSMAAYSRDIRPKLECVRMQSLQECAISIKDGESDVVTMDGGEVYTAQKDHKLKPFLAETYGDGVFGAKYYAVAVVKANSNIKSFADLRGKKSCHTGYGRTAGWNVPLHVLFTQGLIDKETCPYTTSVSSFFTGGSCVPGIKQAVKNAPESLCSLCTEGCVDSGATVFQGYSGAFRCMATGAGDVAFVRHTTVMENTDEAGKLAEWSKNLHSGDFELLCPGGGRAPVTEYARCNLAQVPPHMMVTSPSKSEIEIANMRHTILSVTSLFSKRPEVFQLFGAFDGVKDQIFKDNAKGVVPVGDEESVLMNNYQKILDEVHHCDTFA